MILKKLFLSIACIAFFSSAFAQQEQILKSIENSKEYLKEKDYKSAAGSLQEAINKINDIIGGEILAGLPKTATGFSADIPGDQVTSLGTMMGAGMVVTRNYVDDGKETDAGKSIKMGKYKALFRFVKEENEGTNGYLQMPFYTSVLVFQGNNFKNEEEFISTVQAMNLDNLAKVMGYVKEGDK